ncbi:hypothetical protein [Niastella populi]|uniref:Uncharacterized protein n=1 Tax=Niastella populi TaxID=550983 RepID=A0A1V9ERZ2_9BACT|nr:hypothetical protein [Niastella populi]OQP48886.1 hypothetical protein A4R26_07210 [Niastella populi]
MLTFILITVGFIIIFGVLLLLGIVKKSRKAVYFSLLFFLFALCTGIYTGYLFARKAYHVVRTAENPLQRSGMEIYTALMGKPETNCVTVTNSKDQYVPKLDCCIWLEFTVCPTELKRIIAKQPYRRDSMGLPSYGSAPAWFTPQKLGAGAIALYYSPDPNHAYSLYFSKDSTHAYYCDMLD